MLLPLLSSQTHRNAKWGTLHIRLWTVQLAGARLHAEHGSHSSYSMPPDYLWTGFATPSWMRVVAKST